MTLFELTENVMAQLISCVFVSFLNFADFVIQRMQILKSFMVFRYIVCVI